MRVGKVTLFWNKNWWYFLVAYCKFDSKHRYQKTNFVTASDEVLCLGRKTSKRIKTDGACSSIMLNKGIWIFCKIEKMGVVIQLLVLPVGNRYCDKTDGLCCNPLGRGLVWGIFYYSV